MTDVISKDFHKELKVQLDAFAVSPFGWLGLDGDTFRFCVGYAECVLSLVTLAPSRAHSQWAYNFLGLIMNGAIFAHKVAKDGKELPAQVMLALVVVLRFWDFAEKFLSTLADELAKGKAAMAEEFAAGQAEGREKKAD